jgi:hypothetical protein
LSQWCLLSRGVDVQRWLDRREFNVQCQLFLSSNLSKGLEVSCRTVFKHIRNSCLTFCTATVLALTWFCCFVLVLVDVAVRVRLSPDPVASGEAPSLPGVQQVPRGREPLDQRQQDVQVG